MNLSTWTARGVRVIQWDALADQITIRNAIDRAITRVVDLGQMPRKGVILVLNNDTDGWRGGDFRWLWVKRTVVRAHPGIEEDDLSRALFMHLKEPGDG